MSSTEALQQALAIEHQVIYGYGLVGPPLPAPLRKRCLRRLDDHLLVRDRLEVLVRAAGVQPVQPRPAYAPPFPVTRASAARLAVHLEDAVTGAAWDLVAAGAPASAARRLGIRMLSDAASAAAGWRDVAPAQAGEPALPGQPT